MCLHGRQFENYKRLNRIRWIFHRKTLMNHNEIQAPWHLDISLSSLENNRRTKIRFWSNSREKKDQRQSLYNMAGTWLILNVNNLTWVRHYEHELCERVKKSDSRILINFEMQKNEYALEQRRKSETTWLELAKVSFLYHYAIFAGHFNWGCPMAWIKYTYAHACKGRSIDPWRTGKQRTISASKAAVIRLITYQTDPFYVQYVKGWYVCVYITSTESVI